MGRKNSYLQHLADVPMFRACNSKDLARIARHAEDVAVPAGKALVQEGAIGAQEFFVIASGSATVTRKGRKVATLGPGDCFGELALLERAPRNATVTAATPMEVFVLGVRDFSSVLDSVPGIARRLLAGMARRLREADAKSVQ